MSVTVFFGQSIAIDAVADEGICAERVGCYLQRAGECSFCSEPLVLLYLQEKLASRLGNGAERQRTRTARVDFTRKFDGIVSGKVGDRAAVCNIDREDNALIGSDRAHDIDGNTIVTGGFLVEPGASASYIVIGGSVGRFQSKVSCVPFRKIAVVGVEHSIRI